MSSKQRKKIKIILLRNSAIIMEESNITVFHHSPKSEEFVKELKFHFHDIFLSIYGPCSGAIFITNSCGENYYSSTSKLVLQQIQFKHPFAKLLIEVITAQNRSYGVHGSYLAILCSGLLFRSLQLDVSSGALSSLSNFIIDKIERELQAFAVTRKISFSNTNHVLNLTKSIINSKANYGMSPVESKYFHCKVSQCFIKSLPTVIGPNSDFFPFHIMSIEGPTTDQSLIIDGLLHHDHDRTFSKLQEIIDRKFNNCNNKIILFNVPIAYDSDSPFSFSDPSSYNDFVAKLLVSNLNKNGVKIIANQKFVNSEIKYELEKCGILIIERLGTKLMSSLIRVSGGIPLNAIGAEMKLNDKVFGIVGKLSAVELFEKTYLHIGVPSENFCQTFLITGINSHITSYLQDAARSCIDLLQMSFVKDPRVVMGGGCLEAYILSNLVKMEEIQKLAKQFDTNPMAVKQVFDAFIETFITLAIKPRGGRTNSYMTPGESNSLHNYYIDTIYKHLWYSEENHGTEVSYEESMNQFELKCICRSICKEMIPVNGKFISLSILKHYRNCSLFPNDHHTTGMSLYELDATADTILDYYPAKYNAIRMAFETFSELIQIGECYYD